MHGVIMLPFITFSDLLDLPGEDMLKGVADFLSDLDSALNSINLTEAKKICHDLLASSLSADDLKTIVVFLCKNYQNKLMPLLLIDKQHVFEPTVKFDFITTILIKCASRCLHDEVGALLGLENVNVNMFGCALALHKALNNERTEQRQAVIKSILNFKNADVLWVTRVGRTYVTMEQKQKLTKLRETLLIELAKEGDHVAIKACKFFKESIRPLIIECALGEACIKGHYGTVKTILEACLYGKPQDDLVVIESQFEPDNVERALNFAKGALKFAPKESMVETYLHEFIERIKRLIEQKALEEERKSEVSLAHAQQEFSELMVGFNQLRFSVSDNGDEEPINRKSSQESEEESNNPLKANKKK